MGLRGTRDLPGTGLTPVLVSLRGAELHPQQIPVALGSR